MTLINQVFFIGLFVGCFFAPGWLLLKALNLRRHRFLLSFSLSYALLVIALNILRFTGWPASLILFPLGGVVIFGALWFARFVRFRCFRNDPGCSPPSPPRSFRFRPGILVPFAAVMGLLWVYLWWAGPYLEIPSDAWNHVERLREAMRQINAGQFGKVPSSFCGMFARQGNAWYLVVAYLMRWSGIAVPRVLTPLTAVTVSTFCAGIFFCALAVFRPLRISIWQRGWLAAVASLFCAVTMGVSVFAYIRYYALAPAIFNYLIFLGATLIALDWLNTRKWWTNAIWLIPALMLTMNVIHSQEVLFTSFMIMGLALANIARRIMAAKSMIRGTPHAGALAKSLVVVIIAIIVWLALFYWLRHNNPVIWPTAHTIMPNMPFQADLSVPLIFKAFPISPPAHPVVRLFVYQFYMFYQTIGCWGLFVYVVFLMGFRQMVKSSYLLAGMASPLLTIFNPITIDLFVRLVTLQMPGMSPITIWRFGYMVPLPFVAALALGNAVTSLCRTAGHRNAKSPGQRSSAARIKAIIIIVGLIGLIFPIQNRWIEAPFSRLFTLTGRFGNDVKQWKDLLDFAAGFQNPLLITDRNTCRIFARLYPEYRAGDSQWMNSSEPETQFLEAARRQPDLWKRGLVIINRRDGIPSVTGRISKHWPEDAFLTSCFYSPPAIAFVESRTNLFKLLWAKDRIAVYQITP